MMDSARLRATKFEKSSFCLQSERHTRNQYRVEGKKGLICIWSVNSPKSQVAHFTKMDVVTKHRLQIVDKAKIWF